MPDSSNCCSSCLRFIFTLGLASLFLWLSLRTSKPSVSISQFYIPALNKTTKPPSPNNTIDIQFKLKNTNKDKGVYYDPVNVTFYDSPDRTHRIGNLTIPAFYQGHKKTATRNESVKTYGVQWTAMRGANTTAAFRVDVATRVRYKILTWKTKRETVAVGAVVVVNEGGAKEHKKGIKLKSAATELRSYRAKVGILVNFLVFLFFHFCG